LISIAKTLYRDITNEHTHLKMHLEGINFPATVIVPNETNRRDSVYTAILKKCMF
jgi:hypothetical protein